MKKQWLPERIEGERVFLAKHSESLAPTMFRYVDEDRERLREFLPWVDHVVSVKEELDFIRMTHERWESGELFDYGIFLREPAPLYIGNVGVHSVSWSNDRCELGYWILGKFEGKGYMSEAVTALERVLFDQIGFNRVEIHCSSLNSRSASVPRRLGYQLEGVLRQCALEREHYRDTMIFGKLRSDRGP